MTTAQVVETSVTVNNNSPVQDYVHPDDETQPNFISKSVEQTKKSRKILHHHKTQPIFSEASQTKCRKPFDFPTRISSFPK